MSKAFVNENSAGDAADESGGDESEAQALPKGFKNYITPGGARRLRDELKRLRGAKSRVFAVLNKDRSAMLLGGQKADGA